MCLPGHNDMLTTFLSSIFHVVKFGSAFSTPLFSTFENLFFFISHLRKVSNYRLLFFFDSPFSGPLFSVNRPQQATTRLIYKMRSLSNLPTNNK